MPFTAPHVAGFERARPMRWRRHTHFSSEAPAGVPILTEVGATVNLVVEIAWGAVLSADPSTWQWIDVTKDVQTAGGKHVTVTLGRADEHSLASPAQCDFTLDNRSGAYSKGGQSSNYPNVRINVPIRVRVLYQSVSYTRFFGYAVGFSPDWDATGNHAIVTVKAEGALRRLQLGKKPILSTLRRSIPTLPNLVAYWPCEEGALANQFTSAIGGPAATITPVVTPAAFSGFASSAPIATVGSGGGWNGAVPPYTSTGLNQVRIIGQVPAAGGLPDAQALVGMAFSGTLGSALLIYYAGGSGGMGINFYNPDGSLNSSSGAIAFSLNGQILRYTMEFTQSGGNINWTIATLTPGSSSGGFFTGTVTSRTVNTVTSVAVSPFLVMNGFSAGHVTVESTVTSLFSLGAQLAAYSGENADTRLIRLASENNIPLTIINDVQGIGAEYKMGNQPIDTIINCLRECEVVDQGLLCDGLNNGLTYFVRRTRVSVPAAMTLDASLGDMAMPFVPLDDDFAMRNKQTVTRKGASDFIFEDTTSSFSTSNVGVYDQSLTANYSDDVNDHALHLAEWLVHVGTVSSQTGYRYPKLELDLARRPAQIGSWLGVQLWNRIDVANMHVARSQAPLGPIQLLVEGWTETFNQFRWNIAVNASPYEPWRVAVLANPTGDSNEFICHLDTDGSQVTSLVAAGASSFNVTVTGLAPWTTASDDFPFQVDIAGIPITVTSIGALSGGVQTFTVDPATVLNPIAANTAVSIWRETVLGY